MIRFLTDYRDWLEQISLSRSSFRINFGAVSFADGGSVEPLYVRLEDFLKTADAEGVELQAAMKIWFSITDFMSRSLSLDLPEGYFDALHQEMRSVTQKSDPERFPLIGSYLDSSAGRSLPARSFYDFLVRAFVRGLTMELGLEQPPAPTETTD